MGGEVRLGPGPPPPELGEADLRARARLGSAAGASARARKATRAVAHGDACVAPWGEVGDLEALFDARERCVAGLAQSCERAKAVADGINILGRGIRDAAAGHCAVSVARESLAEAR